MKSIQVWLNQLFYPALASAAAYARVSLSSKVICPFRKPKHPGHTLGVVPVMSDLGMSTDNSCLCCRGTHCAKTCCLLFKVNDWNWSQSVKYKAVSKIQLVNHKNFLWIDKIIFLEK